MKKDTHPNWNSKVTATCACGNTFTTGSTKKNIRVEICSKCHPFYTGQAKLVDIEGRVDKFKKKVTTATKFRAVKTAKVERSRKKNVVKDRPQTLREMLKQIRKEK